MMHHPILCCLFLGMTLTQTYALSPNTWFKNKNQQAAQLMAEQKYQAAAEKFIDPRWQAVAAYRGKNFSKAENQFKTFDHEDDFYNQGNALAYLGKYQEAIHAYDKTLKIKPTHEDAKHNRDVLKKLLTQNQQDQKNQKDQKKQEQAKQQQKQEQAQQQQQHKQEQAQQQIQQQKTQQEQAKNQALRLIPDDPGGLLREKFWRDHWRRLKAENT